MGQCHDKCLARNARTYRAKKPTRSAPTFLGRFKKSSAEMFPDKFPVKSAPQFLDKWPGKNVSKCHRRLRNSNAPQSLEMFLEKSVIMFPGRSAVTFRGKKKYRIVIKFPVNNAM